MGNMIDYDQNIITSIPNITIIKDNQTMSTTYLRTNESKSETKIKIIWNMKLTG